MGSAEGLHAALGNGVALGQLGQFLIGVLYVDDLGETLTDGGLEGLLNLVLDDEDHRLKAGALGVINGIVDDQLAVVAYRVKLLQSAVAAAHTGGHNDQNRFLHDTHSFMLCLEPGRLQL